ncbi:MAG: DNA cytosine methyltransferase [Tissierellales bacterium]|nr:DNA cytosine methyltransferase [Tissierellales bacterium]
MRKKLAEKTLEGIDIFSGAGGMSLGAESAGIRVRFAVDIDTYAIQTYQYNYPETHAICKDIKEVSPDEVCSSQPFIVFGGPPCQGFSNSYTRRNEDLENPRNWMFKQFVQFVQELQPCWFVFENVEGFTRFCKGKLVEELKAALIKAGYPHLYSNVLNASDFGVPQTRKRFFLIGNNLEIQFTDPVKSNNIVTVHEALADLPSLKNGEQSEKLPYKDIVPLSRYAARMRQNSVSSVQNFVSQNKEYVIERYKYIRPGQNWQAIPESLMQNYKDRDRCHTGIYRRLDPAMPAVVIANYRKNMLIHPFEDRGLSLREAARLQSFPDDFIFQGTLDSMQQQIGNAVPPLLAEKIFKQIIQLTVG